MVRSLVRVPFVACDASELGQACPRDAIKVVVFDMVADVEREPIADTVVGVSGGAVVGGAHGLVAVVDVALDLARVCGVQTLRVEQRQDEEQESGARVQK